MNELLDDYYPIDIDIKEINASELYNQYTFGEKYIKTIKFNKNCSFVGFFSKSFLLICIAIEWCGIIP